MTLDPVEEEAADYSEDLQRNAAHLEYLDRKISEVREELDALRRDREGCLLFLERYGRVGDVIATDAHWWRIGATRTSRSVNANRCDELREQLLDVGLGERVVTYKPPTISQIEGAAAALLARGVNPADLINPAGQPQTKVTKVRKDAAA